MTARTKILLSYTTFYDQDYVVSSSHISGETVLNHIGYFKSLKLFNVSFGCLADMIEKNALEGLEGYFQFLGKLPNLWSFARISTKEAYKDIVRIDHEIEKCQ